MPFPIDFEFHKPVKPLITGVFTDPYAEKTMGAKAETDFEIAIAPSKTSPLLNRIESPANKLGKT